MDRPCAAEKSLRRLNCFDVSNRAKNDSGKSSALADNLFSSVVKTYTADLFPTSGSTTLISGPSHACLFLPGHSPLLGTCLPSYDVQCNYMQDAP
jgi:hypothetical protein